MKNKPFIEIIEFSKTDVVLASSLEFGEVDPDEE